ncbi:MAG TPA: hypothetical protein VG318_11550 [Actinomycetota bacterium]|nr:hypothetical protein [Actinomycetota bacterium]
MTKRLTFGAVALAAVVAGVLLVRSQGCWGTFAFEISREEVYEAEDIGILRGGDITRVTHENLSTYASLSPDAERVVFGRAKSYGDETGFQRLSLYVANVDGTGEELLVRDGGQPSWSPVANEVLVLSGNAIRVVDVETKEERIVYELPSPRGANPVDPDYIGEAEWSADGKRIAFFVGKTDRARSENARYYTELWVVGADGSNPHRITALDDVLPTDLAWSPDGRTFAWSGMDGPAPSLIFMDADDVEPRAGEPNARSPHWSRDGDQLAYVIGHEGHYDFRIVVGDADGSDAVTVPGSPREEGGLSFEDWVSC